MDPDLLAEYEKLSPFELKDKLIQMAQSHHEKMMLNAGRGNPNWVATTPRYGFFRLGLFAMGESERSFQDLEHFGGCAQREGIEQRFDAFVEGNAGASGIGFLKDAVAYANEHLAISPSDFLSEMTDAILGDHYPVPDRMLKNCEAVVAAYIRKELGAGQAIESPFDLFATEGGTAAMTYVFQTLRENKLLKKGDTIAIGAPIFTPYLEIPELNDYRFVEVEVVADEKLNWQVPDSEIDKLLDPDVKAFFLTNPSNPPSVKLQNSTVERIVDMVNTKRKDLIILTDDVYCTFTNKFISLFAAAPRNTIGVYSWSKYFGATGWRLGVIAISEGNVMDRMIKALPEADRDELAERYSTISLNPESLKLIDRMVADSRTVALNHTAGLSTPQQVLMTLFSIFCLMDKKDAYKKDAQNIVSCRHENLYKALGIKFPVNPESANYYTEIEVSKIAEVAYGRGLADWIDQNVNPLDFVFRLADEEEVVLMPGGGFDAPKNSVRVSLANLNEGDYSRIGERARDLVDEYYRKWKESQS